MDMDREIGQLQANIARQEALLMEMEAEVLDLHREVAEFQVRYDRIVLPLETRLDAVQGAINDLQAEHRRIYGHPLGDDNPMQDYWQPPPNYVSVEDQFKQTWTVPPLDVDDLDGSSGAPKIKPRAAANPKETNIKKLYRSLAMRYHPDLAADPDEREARNTLMAKINEAYAKRNLAGLQTLAAHPDSVPPDQPLAALQLQELRQINEQLARRISALKLEKADLQHSDMMRLALEEKLARSRGHDLLAEIAMRLEREYNAAMARLEQLRRRG